ncbi:MAG: HAMP domain-containing sensor histidine kinase [Nocardioides sp.]|uniref:sensor histidine kinase n=1 Tax=Nocardioides sp. TaxID=35761 RepID=UPI0039E645A4
MDARELADLLPDGVVVADRDGVVRLVSTVAARMLDVEATAAVGAPLADVLALQDTDGRAWLACNRPYDVLPTVTGIPEQSWLLPDGTEVLVSARIHRPALDAGVERVALALRSGRGRARLDRERSDLVATVSHELRSPLTGVKGFVQALLNRWDKLSDDQKKLMLATVAADADRLSRLIVELLDVARIDTGRLQLYPRPADPTLLVGRVVESVRTTTARSLRFEPPDERLEIWADPDKFTQVVTNLVENAVRHGDGEIAVTLAAEPRGEAGEEPAVRLAVQDQGDGIPAELRRQVFTKFWKGGARGGSGLGLYIVGGLTRAHGGTVTIDDASGGGARITVRWPSQAHPVTTDPARPVR